MGSVLAAKYSHSTPIGKLLRQRRLWTKSIGNIIVNKLSILVKVVSSRHFIPTVIIASLLPTFAYTFTMSDKLDCEKGLSSELTNSEPLSSLVPYTAFLPKRVRGILLLVTMAGFLGPLSGNIYIPLLPLLESQFEVSATTINATVSVFMAVFAVAPLFWASFADFGGRKILYLISLSIFILANVLLATVPTHIAALFILRIVQAAGVSSVMSLGAGTVADVVPPSNRAKAISYFILGPQLGPILGPILSLISANGQWRWIFGFLAILGLVITVLILFLLPETLRCLVGDGEIYSHSIFVTPQWAQKRVVSDKDSHKFPRPPKPTFMTYWKLLKYPPVLLISVTGGLLFATFYGMSVTFAKYLQQDYHFTVLQSCLAYICPGVSLVCGSIIGGRLSDRLRRNIVNKDPESYIPEKRLSLQLVGIIISMVGILGYGWCIDKHVHVVAVFVFMFIGGFGMTWVFVSNTTYLTECSTGQPASNVAIGNFMRNVAAAISSAIIERLIYAMGFNWCFTGLALIDIIGIICTICFLIKGPKWRENYARGPKTEVPAANLK